MGRALSAGPDEDAAALAVRVRDGHRASGARLIRWLEDGDPRGREALAAIWGASGRAHIVGVTGPPGAGKSTLVDALIAVWRARGRSVAVLAVDPTSPFSGGAILGDRVRMQRHTTDPGVFIRSMATRGRLGGLARATFEASVVLDAMGFDVIAIETVGVGQDELDVVALAHTTAVVCLPGMGDRVQALKAGLLECGDCLVLNKADHPEVAPTERDLIELLHARGADDTGWEAPLLKTVAATGEGAAALADAVERHRVHLEAAGGGRSRLEGRARAAFVDRVRERAARRILEAAAVRPEVERLVAAITRREIDPYSAADALVDRFAPDLVDVAALDGSLADPEGEPA